MIDGVSEAPGMGTTASMTSSSPPRTRDGTAKAAGAAARNDASFY
jgi:hypothetical protein